MTVAEDAFGACAEQHGVRKVEAHDARFGRFAEGESEIARAAAKIEDQSVGALQYWAENAGRSFAPEAIELAREQMVEEVVARRDLRKHFADFARSVRFGRGALRARANGRGRSRSCYISHGGALGG